MDESYRMRCLKRWQSANTSPACERGSPPWIAWRSMADLWSNTSRRKTAKTRFLMPIYSSEANDTRASFVLKSSVTFWRVFIWSFNVSTYCSNIESVSIMSLELKMRFFIPSRGIFSSLSRIDRPLEFPHLIGSQARSTVASNTGYFIWSVAFIVWELRNQDSITILVAVGGQTRIRLFHRASDNPKKVADTGTKDLNKVAANQPRRSGQSTQQPTKQDRADRGGN